MKDKLLQIINHYGVLPQLKYLQSEVFELNEAIIRAENPFEPIQDIEHIAAEIADVLVMVYQFLEYYEIDQVEVCKTMDYKIDRQLERIKNERN